MSLRNNSHVFGLGTYGGVEVRMSSWKHNDMSNDRKLRIYRINTQMMSRDLDVVLLLKVGYYFTRRF